MKKYIITILYCGFLSIMSLGFVSCESYLDKTEGTDIDPEAAYKTFVNFQGFVEELYHCIPDFAKQQYNNSFNLGEEEHYSLNGVNQGILVSLFDRGNFWGWQKEHGGMNQSWFDRKWSTTNDGTEETRWQKALWPLAWHGINKANLGIANLHKFTGTEDEKNLIEGQLHFFRGWFHFQLIQYFGGLPYIDQVLDVSGEIALPRESYHTCADKAAADFQKAVDLLPLHWDDLTWHTQRTGNNLRINKIMALAFLGKNYLWAGSPLMNKESTGSESYNVEYCQKAAEVFGELLALVENGETKYALADFGDYSSYDELYSKSDLTYRQLWQTTNGQMPGLTEAIFRGPSWGGTGWSMHHQYCAANIQFQRSWSFYPTANYANYFGMANGMPINEFVDGVGHDAAVADSESGYSPSRPWKNRDPRFYVTYAFDTQRVFKADRKVDEQDLSYANLFSYDPVDKKTTYRDPQSGSTTGYMLVRYNPLGFNQYDESWNNHFIHVSWVRLADIYLMYAEALANGYDDFTTQTAGGCSLTALDAVNKIRNRVKLPDGSRLPGIADKYLASKDLFMSELRRERAVELAFEGHRFNDLRRWLLLIKPPYTYKTSVEFTRKSKTRFSKTDPASNEVLNLREEVILERKFAQKHYWFPLKKADTYMYLEFAQNPGW